MPDPLTRRTLLACALLSLLPVAASGQSTPAPLEYRLRDYVERFASVIGGTTPALVDLVVFSGEADGRRLSRPAAPLAAAMREAGYGRVEAQQSASFGVETDHVIGECAVIDGVNGDAGQWAMHVEVTFWDPNRAADTEVYEALATGRRASGESATDTYVRACGAQLSAVLDRLGFEGG
jgi:hypothetical protein